jgi:small-conductance mechanosensitive channel
VLVLAIAAAFAALWLRRLRLTRIRERCAAAHAPPASFSGRLYLAAAVTTLHYFPHLLVATVVALYAWHLVPAGASTPMLAMAAYSLPVYFVVRVLIFVFLHPPSPAKTLHLLPIRAARSLARRLNVLVLLVLVSYLLFSGLMEQTLPASALALARALFGAVFVLNLLWIAWILGQVPKFETMRWLRVIIALVLLGSLAAEWSGYRNLSLFMLRAVLGTLLLLGFTLLVRLLLRELCDSLDAGRYAWQRWLHRRMGLAPEKSIPGMGWVRFIMFIVLWGGFLLAALRIWGLTGLGMPQLVNLANQGFSVGSLTIVPTRILWAVIAFVVLLSAKSWITHQMERRWLPHTHMDRGAREAMVTITGYVGLAIALMVALGVAGMSFGNVAIIAGALSVGIGFGLQNIVNNFVSGLILLFERPVKTGDWIVVGNTEGYVRRISIRSTQIQTFDRADVIVPNSELISNQVTNWMLHDPRGRIRLPVGVAYGSDTQLVKEILLRIAEEHPVVVTDGSTPEPVVLFRGFGDSSLDFELRCFITNIDVRLTVISDLNFAIDAEFRKHGIEIPFPQRDLHVRNWPGPPGGGAVE